MKRLIPPLFALVSLLGACSSTPSALNTQPVPAKSAGTADTRWGSLPAYTADRANPILLDPQAMPAPQRAYSVKVNLLVERDGTVRDVEGRKTSGIPGVDAALVAKFKGARSRLILAPSDTAPYVISYTVDHRLDIADANTPPRNDYRFVDDRPMGTGQPTPAERGY